MAETSYQVVFTGDFAEGLSRGEILGRLETLLRKPPAELRALFHGAGAVIIARTTQAMAQKYVTSLNQTGALCEARERQQAPEEPKPGAVATQPEPTTNGAAPPAAMASVDPNPTSRPNQRPPLRTLVPISGPVDITLSPLLCANAAGHPGGLSTNRKDWGSVLFSDIKMLAAFKSTEMADEVKLLLFPATSRRPLLIEANTIAFAQFPGVAAGKFLPTLRNFLIKIYRSNRAIVLDQTTAEFMKGGPPPQFSKDPVILISDLDRAFIAASAQS